MSTVRAIREQAQELGFEVREASFDTGVIILGRDKETFRFEGPSATREALRLAEDAVARFAALPRHARSCSNQNVLNPLGAYRGVESCGCNRS